MATLQSGKCFTVPTFVGMCCRSEWQERMYIYKWHEVDQTKHEIFCVHIVCNEIQVKVNLEITTFFFYLRFPYCPNFFWFGVVYNNSHHMDFCKCCDTVMLRYCYFLLTLLISPLTLHLNNLCCCIWYHCNPWPSKHRGRHHIFCVIIFGSGDMTQNTSFGYGGK